MIHKLDDRTKRAGVGAFESDDDAVDRDRAFDQVRCSLVNVDAAQDQANADEDEELGDRGIAHG